VIILSLLHPIKQIPVQLWTFPNESVIRVGRATDNQVILYSAVVSRRHVELRRTGLTWEVVNLGTNGTYLDGKRISQTALMDGAVIRLARSGPNIQVRIGEAAYREMLETVPATLMGHQRSGEPNLPTEITSRPSGLEADLDESIELIDPESDPLNPDAPQLEQPEASFSLDDF
jgi:pSer/pThr/pTyr-binding forkhead associated (FHA) protein